MTMNVPRVPKAVTSYKDMMPSESVRFCSQVIKSGPRVLSAVIRADITGSLSAALGMSGPRRAAVRIALGLPKKTLLWRTHPARYARVATQRT